VGNVNAVSRLHGEAAMYVAGRAQAITRHVGPTA
jgi:hypothetical protein